MEKDWFAYDRAKQQVEIHVSGRPVLLINEKDIEVSYYSGGPGGQNVNRNMNGVRLIYRIPSEYIQPFKKTRELIARSINERSKEQNMKAAFSSLAEKLERYFYMPPKRQKTKVPKKSKMKRLNDKKKRANIKHDRNRVDY